MGNPTTTSIPDPSTPLAWTWRPVELWILAETWAPDSTARASIKRAPVSSISADGWISKETIPVSGFLSSDCKFQTC